MNWGFYLYFNFLVLHSINDKCFGPGKIRGLSPCPHFCHFKEPRGLGIVSPQGLQKYTGNTPYDKFEKPFMFFIRSGILT